MKNTFKLLSVAFLWALPAVVLAQSGGSSGVFEVLNLVMGLIVKLIPIVIAIAVLTFLWGVLSYVVAKDQDKQAEARMTMLYGVIALFVMVSVWGLVNILGDTLRLDQVAPPPPALPTY